VGLSDSPLEQAGFEPSVPLTQATAQSLDEVPAGGRACYQREVLSLPRLIRNAGI
jgi:hypothetical protein